MQNNTKMLHPKELLKAHPDLQAPLEFPQAFTGWAFTEFENLKAQKDNPALLHSDVDY